jgi:hypothetical protein
MLSGKTWDEFCDALKAAGRDILENSAADELERAEGFRYLARLSAHGLRNSFSSAALSAPTFNYDAPKIGANNPDFLYGVCRISGACSYRIRGRANAAFNFNIGAYHGSLGSAEGLQCSAFASSPAHGYRQTVQIIANQTRHPETGCSCAPVCPAAGTPDHPESGPDAPAASGDHRGRCPRARAPSCER